MSRAGRLAQAAALLLATLVQGCGSPYVTATESFGRSASAGVAAFTPIFDTASELCFRDAELEHLQDRLENGSHGWGTDPLLGEIRTRGTVKVLEPGGTKMIEESVADRCGRLEIADAVLQKALLSLSVYGRALESLASGIALDTKGIAEIASSSAGLGTMLSANPTSSKAQTETMLQVIGPLGELARVIARGEVEGDLRETIRRSDPHVSVILGKARLYVKATRAEARSAQNRTETLLNTADQKIRLALQEAPRPSAKPPAPAPVPAPVPVPEKPAARASAAKPLPAEPPPPLTPADLDSALHAALDAQLRRGVVLRASVSPQDVFALYELASKERRQAAQTLKALDSFDAILAGLSSAEAELLSAADGKVGEKDALGRVLAASNTVLLHIEMLKALASRKE